MENEYQNNSIKVFGTSKIEVRPDQAEVYVSIVTEGKDLNYIKKQDEITTQRVLSALQKQGVSLSEIETVNYQIAPKYQYVDNEQILVGYQIINDLKVKTSNLDDISKIIDTAVKAGANTIKGIQYSISNYDYIYNNALALALIDAKEKALTLANTMGVSIFDTPYLVRELASQSYKYSSLTRSYEGTPILPSKINIEANLEVYFKY